MSTIAANSPGAAISLPDVLADNLQTLVLLSGTSPTSVGSVGSFFSTDGGCELDEEVPLL